jgi:hypothetical protein
MLRRNNEAREVRRKGVCLRKDGEQITYGVILIQTYVYPLFLNLNVRMYGKMFSTSQSVLDPNIHPPPSLAPIIIMTGAVTATNFAPPLLLLYPAVLSLQYLS